MDVDEAVPLAPAATEGKLPDENLANGHSVQDISYHPGLKVKFFTHPRQRQKWGDTQILPRTNWGDIFFDLFYVAAAYNMANILVESPTAQGFLYFCGTFFPIMGLWNLKLLFDSRYSVGDDLWHRLYEAGYLILVATAVLHIRPLELMANPKEHVEMFAFALALSLATAFAFLRYTETYFFGVGQREVIKKVSVRDIRFSLMGFILYVAAAIYSGIQFFGDNDISKADEEGYDGPKRLLADAADGEEAGLYYSDSTGDTTDTPIYLVLSGAIASLFVISVDVIFCFPSGGKHKQSTIPINMDFAIHRNGEWIMLMFGESVLSLLIVDPSEGGDYYLTFYAGVLTIVLGQLLHFQSQPHHAHDHAMRRNKNAGILWNFTNQVYSAALICIGASFKLFLYEFSYDERRVLLEEAMEFETTPRWLAGDGASAFSTEDRRQRSATLYCAAMATVWFCSDLMLFFHFGFIKLNSRCRSKEDQKYSHKGVLFMSLRVVLLVFVATLSQWETDPEKVSLIGLGAVCLQLLLRVLGNVLFHEQAQPGLATGDREEVSDHEAMKWPNVTHAVAVESKELDPDELTT